jgi:alpha-galactosidase
VTTITSNVGTIPGIRVESGKNGVMTEQTPASSLPDVPPIHLRARGVSLVVDCSGPDLPRILHWGHDLGPATDEQLLAMAIASVPPVFSADAPLVLSLAPGGTEGWPGTPAVSGQRPGDDGPSPVNRAPFPCWRSTTVDTSPPGPDPDGSGSGSGSGSGGTLHVQAEDPDAALRLTIDLGLDRFGVLHAVLAITNTGEDHYEVDALRALLPVPATATEVLDLTGTWCRERFPQRSPLRHGTHLRASRRGRTGHDATLLLVAGTAGFAFRSGTVWASHVAWSGNHEQLLERLPEGAGPDTALLGGGELLAPGEVRIAPGETYTSPEVLFVWSDQGLDGLSQRLHRRLRAREVHPRSPRPLVLNTWEAVYFDHGRDRLHALVDAAAAVGVERFVLDDGWFRNRRDDTAGLGDWYVDESVWPQGLHPLVDHVHRLGMQMGLWVEPEMVNPDSDLARAHPDWVLTPGARTVRHQLVLDLARPEVYRYLLERLDALVGEYSLDLLKWDHNRDLHLAVHAGRPGTHAQTVAVYRLLDELGARHPGLEIESCAGGGGRVDLGILGRTHRVWASDANDAVDRLPIQLWTTLLLPPELVGSHLGPPTAHTTGRTVPFPLRAATALFGHAGIEWDLTGCSSEELAALTRWAGLYRELRPLVHHGEVVRADLADPGAVLHGVVRADRREALFCHATLASSANTYPGRIRLPGLDPDLDYRVRPRYEVGRPTSMDRTGPPWLDGRGVVLSGAVLEHVGLTFPVSRPMSALLVHLTAE